MRDSIVNNPKQSIDALTVLAHRGWWKQPLVANSIAACEAALVRGLGVEFDVRDYSGKLVIAHDVLEAVRPCVADLAAAYCQLQSSATLAINIKADGLGALIEAEVVRRGITNYFCFDMSLPESLRYRRLGLRYFTRESEYEPAPVLYDDAAGVWMDMFESDWITADGIRRHLDRGKQVALVSPELHRRPYMPFWERLRAADLTQYSGLMLCTDHPDAARSFFDA